VAGFGNKPREDSRTSSWAKFGKNYLLIQSENTRVGGSYL